MRRSIQTWLRSTVIAALLLGSVPTSTGGTDEPAPEEVPVGPGTVSIPYGETASISAAAPWLIVDCAAVAAASEWVTDCAPDQISLAADEYDPDAPPVTLPVALTTGSQTMTVHYRLILAPPPSPSVAPAGERFVAAGAILRVPLTDFRIECMRCADGGSTRILAVDPAEGGAAWTTDTHVVFRAADGFQGPVDVHVAVADDFGTAADTGIHVWVYPGDENAAVIALDMAVPLDEDGRAEIDLATLMDAGGDAAPVVVGCGPSFHGAVTCAADGHAVYRGDGRADQFSFHVVAGGEQAWGSVTVREAGGDAGPVGSAPAGPLDQPVTMSVIPPVPPTTAQTGAGGVFDPFRALLDRVGAQ